MSTLYSRSDTSAASATSELYSGLSRGGGGGPSSSPRALFLGSGSGSSSSSSPIGSCPFSTPFLVLVFPSAIPLTEHPHGCRFAWQELIPWWRHLGSLGVAVHPNAVVVPFFPHPSHAHLGCSGPSVSMYASRVPEPSPLASPLRAAFFASLDKLLCLAFFPVVGADDAGRRDGGLGGSGSGSGSGAGRGSGSSAVGPGSPRVAVGIPTCAGSDLIRSMVAARVSSSASRLRPSCVAAEHRWVGFLLFGGLSPPWGGACLGPWSSRASLRAWFSAQNAEGIPCPFSHSFAASFRSDHICHPAAPSTFVTSWRAVLSLLTYESRAAGSRPTHPHHVSHPSLSTSTGFIMLHSACPCCRVFVDAQTIATFLRASRRVLAPCGHSARMWAGVSRWRAPSHPHSWHHPSPILSPNLHLYCPILPASASLFTLFASLA
jgi:hypothetical protein